MISGHGSDLYRYKQGIIADFSSNVWYKGVSSKLIKHLKSKLKSIIHYPEPDAGSLSKKIAQKYNLKDGNVLVANGATEAFYLVAQVFKGYDSFIVYPSFSEYEDACKVYDHHLHYLDIKDFNKNVTLKSNALFWLGNPNNPDGTITSKKTIRELCDKNPNIIFVIDEAYKELCDGSESIVSLLNEFDNLIIIHSLTKAFAIPGIRLGYLLASKKIIDKLYLIKMPWSVNNLAIEAGNFILADYNRLLPDIEILVSESKAFQKSLKNISGLEVKKSECNYFLLRLKKGKAGDLKQYLIEKHGLLIRDASNFKGLDTSYFRISIQEFRFNKLLINAIEEWINTSK